MLKKRFLKSKNLVQVTFYTAAALSASEVCLVGDFNDWDETATPMKALKDGRFKIVLELDPDSEFQFRYLVNGDEWHNDWEADQYVPNPHGSDNCVVCT
ncbi:MAG: isoamylase early set domain-containing protein [Chloroflexi bacterium]|nr:isoamylase early set domain-containing protein [Chloroflexota bacterium]